MEPLNKINREYLKIAYKLFYDIFLVSLIFFLGSLVAEGVMPGIVTNHVGFSRMVFAVFVVAMAIYILGDFLAISPVSQKANKKSALALMGIFALLVINSLLKLNIFLILVISLVVFVTSYFIYKTFLEENSPS